MKYEAFKLVFQWYTNCLGLVGECSVRVVAALTRVVRGCRVIDLGAALFVTRPRLGKRLVGKWTCGQVVEEESKAYLRGSQREKSRAMGDGMIASVTMVAVEERRGLSLGKVWGREQS